MLERKVFSQFKKWKDSSEKKALMVTGARQIGKTHAIRAFAHENYKSVLEK